MARGPSEIWSSGGPVDGPGAGTPPVARDGFDLIFLQTTLQGEMAKIEDDIRKIQKSNSSDTEKMFSMQMAMNTWSAVANLRTNMVKSVSDALQGIVKNVTV